MRKLVFMDIASYLPCDLAYAFIERKNAVTLSPKITNQGFLSVNGNQHNVNNNVLGMFPEESCYKPILRSIYSLTEEIEHKGEVFTPIVELLKQKHPYNDYLSKYGEITHELNFPFKAKAFYSYRANFEISISLNNLLEEPYWVVLKLIEWKFDISHLIKDALALDVNYLKFNPYK
jgi:hypothetical protein